MQRLLIEELHKEKSKIEDRIRNHIGTGTGNDNGCGNGYGCGNDNDNRKPVGCGK